MQQKQRNARGNQLRQATELAPAASALITASQSEAKAARMRCACRPASNAPVRRQASASACLGIAKCAISLRPGTSMLEQACELLQARYRCPSPALSGKRRQTKASGLICCNRSFAPTNSASFLLSRYLARSGNVRWTCPSGWWLGWCAHCLSTCPRARTYRGLVMAALSCW